jgi:predicted DNA-binding transcriptional regulator AlpA
MPRKPISQTISGQTPADPNDVYLTTNKVLARYGRSQMWLWRLYNGGDPSFPAPMYIGKNRYWSLNQLAQWERACAAARSPERDNEAGERHATV